MNLENRVRSLEAKQKSLDTAFREMMKVIAGTHEVVGLILKEQLEMRIEMKEFRSDMESFKQETRENFRQVELLIRQTHSNH